ncbi:MAG: beta-ketoacyl synthase N-terminal-like domain-containing protein, partial [Candidatus Rokuibacteriota bacterium]
MAEPAERVVVTGVGTVSALGVGGATVLREALHAGVPRIGPVRAFSTAGCSSHLGGEVGELSPYLDPQEARRLARVSQFVVVAARLALEDAGLEVGRVAQLGLVLGSAYGDFRSSEAFAQGYLERGPLGLSPVVFPNTVMNTMAAQAAILVAARGPMLTVSEPGIAGELAVARGASLIQAGRARVVLAGGADELCPILYQELARLGTLSPRPSGPEACRPFDRRANGSVRGEGATMVVLEAADHAETRQARIYGELTGVAWGNLPAPAHGVPAPCRRDPAVIRRALQLAGVGPADVDAVYLSGTGEPEQDACELDLVARAFAAPATPPRLTALTPLAGDHAGLGALRVAAAAAITLPTGWLPHLPELTHPVRGDL